MDNKILLDNLLKQALISPELHAQILNEAARGRRPAEEIILSRHLVDEAKFVATKSQILKIPYRTLKPEEIQAIPANVIQSIPEETVETYRVAPLELKEKLLVVGMVNPEDLRAQEALRFLAKRNGLNLGVYLITATDWNLIRRRYSPYESEIERAIKSLDIKPGGEASPFRPVALEEEGMVSEEAPIIKIVASTMEEAVQAGASDVHIEPQKTKVRVRFRVDGLLQEITSFPIELHQPIVSRIKIISNLKIDVTRIPQDGRFRTIIFGKDIDFRVSTFPTPIGEKVAIRVLDPTVGLKGIDELGLIGRTAEMVREAIKRPFGMVLVSGPTGSGKTTTLYSLMQILNKIDVNVMSLEDPVEYVIEGVNQSQVRPEIGYNFASGLRQIVRQDPDVILVGEIRDNETAELAVHAALTGQIVLSTLHTNNAIGVIPRLIDMRIEPFLLPSALNLMVSQRLVRRLCDKCKGPVTASPEVQEIIASELKNLPSGTEIKYKPPYEIYRGKGCDVCKKKGVVGRIALFEAFIMTRELEGVINTNPTESKIYDEAKRQGMITLRQDGILKALQGIVGFEDVLRETAES
ncbi:MAG: Flp pilus assembly complex ATPase component TadA [Candidatus Colwellbacteria bacterium]|nr:Flp pilus assembly complex ATPase component TadA [Candidatus Colwellbacteria bacterium]